MTEERVLVVDDEPAIRRMLSTALRLAGYRVSEAREGNEALEQTAFGQDVIVLDLEMPRMNGIELLDRLRTNPATAAIPVLVVTAREVSEVPGASALLRKPCGVFLIVDTVTKLLHRQACAAAKRRA